MAYSPDGRHAVTVAVNGVAKIWPVADLLSVSTHGSGPNSELYTNTKVLLVGESQAGKSGLALVLAGEAWRPTASTIGAFATRLPPERSSEPHQQSERADDR